MANFTDEAAVRLKIQVDDTSLASADLVAQSIDEAHAALTAVLDPAAYTVTTPDALTASETELAGALVLRAVAAKQAVTLKTLTVGGQRVEAGRGTAVMLDIAAQYEGRAWDLAAPYRRAPAARPVAGVTDTVAVRGGC